MPNFIRRRKKTGESGQALVLVLVLLALGSLFITAMLGFIGNGAKIGQVYDKKAAELYAADAGIQDATWQIRNQELTTTCPTYSRYDFRSPGWSYDIPAVNTENVHVQLWNMWMIPSTIIAAPTDVATPQGIATAGKLLVTGNTIMPVKTADDGSTIYEYDINIAYTPGTGENLTITNIGVWFPPGFSYFADAHHVCNLTSLTNPYNSNMTVVPLAGNNDWYWTFPSFPSFSTFPGHTGTAPAVINITVTMYFKPPQDQPTLKPDAVAWIKTSGVGDIPYSWDSSVTIFKTTVTAKKGTDAGTIIDSYMAHSELPQLQTAQNGDYYATGKTMMKPRDSTSENANRRELLLTHNDSAITTLPTNDQVEKAYLYWSGWLHQPITGNNPDVGAFWDNCNQLDYYWQSHNNNLPLAQISWSVPVVANPEFDSQFRGHYNSSGGTDGKYLEMKSNVDLTGVSSATLQWDQYTTAPPSPVTVFNDTVSQNNINPNGSKYWTVGGSTDWSYSNSSGAYRARYYNSYDTYLTVKNPQTLSAYYNTTTPVTLSFTWWSDSNLGIGNGLNVQISSDGTNFVPLDGFTNSKTTAETKTYTLTNTYLTNTFKMRFQLVGNSASKYCYIDNISIIAQPQLGALYFNISKDGGNTWTPNSPANLACTANTTTTTYSYPITDSSYFNSKFRLRFYIDGYSGTNDYIYLDNILISVTSTAITAHPADTSVTFIINTNDGTNRTYTEKKNADPNNPDEVQSQPVIGSTHPYEADGYYYGCRVDVTDLIKAHSNGYDGTVNPVVYGNGNATYSVSGAYGDSERANQGTLALPGAAPFDGSYGSASYAGWSLVIIYSSPDTLGHQLYLYDLKNTFRSVPSTENNSPPVQISGFIIPQQNGETGDAAKLTVFVGEGDIQIPGDYIAMVDQRGGAEHPLWDGTMLGSDGTPGGPSGSLYNVWNSRSTENPSVSEAGIDLDSFHILWSDNILKSGDTSANLNFHTYGDGYVTIYMILSVRSKITTGGSIGYLIRN